MAIRKENYLTHNWHILAFIVYAIICLFDFTIMPMFVFFHHSDLINDIVKNIASLNPDNQKKIIDHLYEVWTPLTIQGYGIFHMSFGAIMGVNSYKRSSERIEEMRHNIVNASLPIQNP